MTAIQNVFKRNDPQVQEDALTLDLDGFKRKYGSQAKETVLAATWKEAHKKQQQANKTDEANDLPTTPVKKVTTELSDKSVLTNTTLASGVQVASIDNDPNGGQITNLEADVKAGSKKKEKKDKKEAPATVKTDAAPKEKAVVTGDRPSRAERLRGLIAAGKTKAESKEILVGEGYDVATIHSEWNRLTKKKD